MHFSRRRRLPRAIAVLVLAASLASGTTHGRAASASSARPLIATAQQQVIADPGLESTGPPPADANPYWQQYSRYSTNGHPSPTIDGSFPYHGNYSADLCGADNCLDEVAQPLVAPAQVVSAQLYFVYSIQTNEANGNSACNDQLNVGMGQSGTLDGSAAVRLCNQTGNGRQYQLAHVDVTSWVQARPSSQVQVLAVGTTNDLYYTQFWVDDITLSITYLTTPTAPSSVTAVSTSAGTAALSWTAPSTSGTSGISGYTITPYVVTAANPQGVAQPSTTTSGSATTATVGGLTNGSTYLFTVAASNASGSGPPSTTSNSVTPDTWALALSGNSSVSSTAQYALPSSDGVAWQDMDMQNLGLGFVAAGTGQAIVSANADLWTASAGFNQDIGIAVHSSDGAYTEANGLIGWKESGGGATFAPNAAYLQAAMAVQQGVTYQVKLRWKTNRSALGATIYAAAGGRAPFSPTRLAVQQTAQLSEASNRTAVLTTTQGHLPANSGADWVAMDGRPLTDTTSGATVDNGFLRMTLTPTQAARAELSLNADLFTSQPGHDQDIGIYAYTVTGGDVSGGPALVAWKESGGNSGVFSPNAAYLQALYPVAANQRYLFVAVWKANNAVGSNVVYAGAGNGPYSPTRLTGLMYPVPGASATPQKVAVNGAQFIRPAGAAAWTAMTSGAGAMTLSYAPAASGTVVLSGNADLFTDHAGPNQDIGIRISGGAFNNTVVAWKESGGSGVYSPNAATVQASVNLAAGTVYTITLVWKTNVDSPGTTVYAGAGPLGDATYSPTSLEILQG